MAVHFQANGVSVMIWLLSLENAQLPLTINVLRLAHLLSHNLHLPPTLFKLLHKTTSLMNWYHTSPDPLDDHGKYCVVWFFPELILYQLDEVGGSDAYIYVVLYSDQSLVVCGYPVGFGGHFLSEFVSVDKVGIQFRYQHEVFVLEEAAANVLLRHEAQQNHQLISN